jgi:uncharacterized protein (DUF885 family)
MNSDPQDSDYFGDLTEYGVIPQSNLLTINSLEYQSDMKTYFEDALIHLESFGVESTDESYINYLNVKWFIEMELEKLEYGKRELLLTHMFGEHQELYSLLNEIHIIESEQDAEDWIDRVIMSEVKIKDMMLELRTLMEDSLGDAYDIKEFHHLVLANGILPLDILEEYILDYIENNK